MKNQTGYSWLTVRSIDEEKRIIEGIATTPQQARDGDIVATEGIQFKLPIPFLWRHKDPMGNVTDASVSADGIRVRIQVGQAGISTAIDEQWRQIKAGIVRGLSIGFRILEESFSKEIGGYKILKSEWLELSAVPVPADAGAMITSVRSADLEDLAALGEEGRSARRTLTRTTPGVSGARKSNGGTMKTFAEKIRDLEALRAPVVEKMTAIYDKTETEAREMDATEKEAYKALSAELTDIDDKLDVQRSQARAAERAVPVPSTPDAPARTSAIEVTKVPLPKGNLMARAAIAMIQSHIRKVPAADLAARHYADTPEVAMYLRATVDAADTTTSGWASQLVPAAQQMQNDFLDLLRPATLVGRIPGLRSVPFNVAVPLQSGGGTYGWVGESVTKPVTSLTVGSATLRWSKIAGIIVFTKELARFSSPSAEAIIRNDMIKGLAAYMDTQFCDPNVAAVSNVSPASITNTISPLTPTGTTADDLRYDLSRLMANFITNNQDPSGAVILMTPTTAARASLMMNSLGQPQFPGISITGGTIAGLPVIVSNSVGTRIILVNASDILLADDGGVSIDVSEEATVEMSTTPITQEESPLSTSQVLHSLWQRNEIGLRVERFVSWTRARTSAVEFIATPAYVPTHS